MLIYSVNNRNVTIFLSNFWRQLLQCSGCMISEPFHSLVLIYSKKWHGHLFPKIILFPLPVFFSHHNGVLRCSSPYWFLYIFHDEIFNKASQEFVRQSVPGRIKLLTDVVFSQYWYEAACFKTYIKKAFHILFVCPATYSMFYFSDSHLLFSP